MPGFYAALMWVLVWVFVVVLCEVGFGGVVGVAV